MAVCESCASECRRRRRVSDGESDVMVCVPCYDAIRRMTD